MIVCVCNVRTQKVEYWTGTSAAWSDLHFVFGMSKVSKVNGWMDGWIDELHQT